MGRPAIGSSGLSGSRVALSRAGISTTVAVAAVASAARDLMSPVLTGSATAAISRA
jgi:hypothetical protein